MAGPDLEPMLSHVAQGMDAALVQAVEANRRALQQIVDQGAQLRETHVKKAVAYIENMEDALFTTVAKSIGEFPQSVQGPWSSVLDGMKLKGSATGASATAPRVGGAPLTTHGGDPEFWACLHFDHQRLPAQRDRRFPPVSPTEAPVDRLRRHAVTCEAVVRIRKGSESTHLFGTVCQGCHTRGVMPKTAAHPAPIGIGAIIA